MKNKIYIDALEFQVAYYFDSVEWFKQDFAKLYPNTGAIRPNWKLENYIPSFSRGKNLNLNLIKIYLANKLK